MRASHKPRSFLRVILKRASPRNSRSASSSTAHSRMIRIPISPAAYAAIAGTLSAGVERQRAENGDIYVWFDPGIVAKLKAMQGPGETYNDVILRLAGRQTGMADGREDR
jgi:hypothetical protein